MTTIDNIMALADEYALAEKEDYLYGHGRASHDRDALRAAIEAALKMAHLDYSGCMEDLAELERQEPVSRVVLRDGEPTLLLDRDIKATDQRLYTAPQPQPCNPAEDGVCEALECCKDGTELRQLREQNTMLDAEAAKDEVLLRQALDALENHTAIKHPQQRYYREAAIAALRERLDHGKR